ncbi:MAG: PRC-barrel domain-containing protein [Chloroflexota bacterium]
MEDNDQWEGDYLTMRLKDLRGLPVIDPKLARRIGSVLDFQVDPVSGRLAALDVGSSSTDQAQRILAASIRRVGRSAVILTAAARDDGAGAAPAAHNHWLDASSLSGLEVVGDDGSRVGRLMDASFDQDSLKIEVYLLRSGILQRALGRPRRIAPAQVQSCSRELMMIVSGGVRDPGQASAPGETAARLSAHLPLKAEDRPSTSALNQIADGQTTSARSG